MIELIKQIDFDELCKIPFSLDYDKHRPICIIDYYKSQTGNKNISKFKPKIFKKTKFGRKENDKIKRT